MQPRKIKQSWVDNHGCFVCFYFMFLFNFFGEGATRLNRRGLGTTRTTNGGNGRRGCRVVGIFLSCTMWNGPFNYSSCDTSLIRNMSILQKLTKEENERWYKLSSYYLVSCLREILPQYCSASLGNPRICWWYRSIVYNLIPFLLSLIAYDLEILA